MTEKNMIKIYVDASSAKRVDIIIKHYTDFMGIVDGYTEGLRYMIECEKKATVIRRWEILVSESRQEEQPVIRQQKGNPKCHDT